MNQAPHSQRFAFRRSPSTTVYPSTFQPQQNYGHSHQMQILQERPNAYQSTAVTLPQAGTAPPSLPQAQGSSGSGNGGGGILGGLNLASLTKYANVDELKGLVDRFGGLDGILTTVTKVQKVVSAVGQIGPMVKVFSGVWGKGANKNEEEPVATARRRPSSKSRARRGRRVNVNRPSSSQQQRKSKSVPYVRKQPKR